MSIRLITDVVKIRDVLLATSDEARYVSIDLPDTPHINDLWQAVDDDRELHPDGDGWTCRTPFGEVRFMETLQGEEIAPGACWEEVGILAYGPGEMVRLDTREGPEILVLAGDGETPRLDLLRHVQEAVPIGSRVLVQRGIHGSIAAMTHPDPTLDLMTVAYLGWKDVDPEQFGAIVLRHGTAYGRTDFGILVGDDGTCTKSAGGSPRDRTLSIYMVRGHICLGEADAGFTYMDDSIIVVEGEIPDTVAASLIGRPLSHLLDLPFQHHDPLIESIDCSMGDMLVRYERTKVRLSTMAPD